MVGPFGVEKSSKKKETSVERLKNATLLGDLDQLLVRAGGKVERGKLMEDIEGKGTKEIVPFAVRRKAIFEESWEESREQSWPEIADQIDPERKKLRQAAWKKKWLEKLLEESTLRESIFLLKVISFDADGNELSRREMKQRAASLNTLMEEYGLERLTDVLEGDLREEMRFAEDFGAIVGRDPEWLLSNCHRIKREELELRKDQKIVEDDESFEEMYEAQESGEGADLEEMKKRKKHLFEEEDKAIAELEAREQEIILEFEREEAVESEEFEELQAEDLSEMLEQVDVEPETFSDVMELVAEYLENPASLHIEDGRLAFSLVRDGVEVAAAVDGNVLVLRDEQEDVKVAFGDKLGLYGEIEVFWVKAQLKRQEENGDLLVPQEHRNFFYSRGLAKLVGAISNQRVAIGGQRLDRGLEIERIYGHFLAYDSGVLLGLQERIDAADNDAALEVLAEEVQRGIA